MGYNICLVHSYYMVLVHMLIQDCTRHVQGYFPPTHPITAHFSEEASLTILADAVDDDKRTIFCAHIFHADYFR